jgi:drug/metabolite transporter (DMT)-like permease
VKKVNFSTILGFLAIVLWSTSVAFLRSVQEKNGTLNTAFFNLLLGSLFLLIFLWWFQGKELFSKMKKIPLRYFYKVGTFMVIYMVFFYVAVGDASSREAVIVVGIINYLWPGLTFLFSVPVLKNKARHSLLITGIVIAFIGTVMAFMEANRVSLVELKSSLKGGMLPFLFAFFGAVSWGLYSNMTRKYAVKEDIAALPVLFFISAVFFLIIELVKGEALRLHLSGSGYLEFAYLVIFPTAIAYLSWDRAMKKGNKNFISALSYGIPLVSTLTSCYYLHVHIRFGLYAAAFLVIIGAVLCRKAVYSPHRETGD